MKKIFISFFCLFLAVEQAFALTPIEDGIGFSNDLGCVSLSYNLRYRSKDSNTNGEVSDLQAFLQDKGFISTEPTGYFGRLTESAVKSYQYSKGISATGYVGPITRTQIQTDSCGGAPMSTIPVCELNKEYSFPFYYNSPEGCTCPTGSNKVGGSNPLPGSSNFICRSTQTVLPGYSIDMYIRSKGLNKDLVRNTQGYFDATDVDGEVAFSIQTRELSGCGYGQTCPAVLGNSVAVNCTTYSKTNGGQYAQISTSKKFTQNYNKYGLGLDYYKVSCGDGVNTKKIEQEFIVETRSPSRSINYCPVGGQVFTDNSCTCPENYRMMNVSNLVSYFSNQASFECVQYGFVAMKPVIYLYPATTTDVSVQLDYKGKVFVSYPEMGSGWNVTAKTDGTLINKADGREYSYLFWEGKPAEKPKYDMSKGFLVKSQDARAFLQEKLAALGMTPKEYNEFIVYWYPKMQDNAYTVVHFATKSEYDDKALLSITPKPESLLRVFMVIKAADKSTEVVAQDLQPFERKGFSVVEWGGTEIK